MAAAFTPETMRFLRGLARHNDRAWFEARRTIYERAAREPMLALIEAIHGEMADFAPDYLRPAHKVALRIYRDTRFSPDKRPYKTHLGAWWFPSRLNKDAAGFYVDLAPTRTFIAAGLYAPQRDALLAIRRWLASHHERFRATLAPLLQPGPAGEPALEPLPANPLTRNPAGFAPDHPAGDLLRARNWGVTLDLPTEAALAPDFAATVAAHLRRVAPLVELLNAPLHGER